jgi:acyl carrier protein
LGNERPTEVEIRDWCSQYLAKQLKTAANRVDQHAKFSRLGIDSTTSVFLIVALEEWLGLELSSDIAFEYPSIVELAGYLAKRCADQSNAEGRAG